MSAHVGSLPRGLRRLRQLLQRGAARVVSGVATRLRPDEGLQLPVGYVEQWRQRRAALEKRRVTRRQQARFRRDPATYLQNLEQQALQLSLPS